MNPLLDRLAQLDLAIFTIRASYVLTNQQMLQLIILKGERFEILGLIEGANAEL